MGPASAWRLLTDGLLISQQIRFRQSEWTFQLLGQMRFVRGASAKIFQQSEHFSPIKWFSHTCFTHELDICFDYILFSTLAIKILIMHFISPPNWPNLGRLLFLGPKWVSSSSSAAIRLLCKAQGRGALTPRWLMKQHQMRLK